jgi:pimeloyl-[acyl-carrier protein] methyl ester esterase
MPRTTLEQFSSSLVRDPDTTLERFLALQVRGTADARTTLRGLKDAIRARPAPRAEALEQGLEILRNSDFRPHLESLGRPSHWLFGERDTLVPCGVAERLARDCTGAHVRVLPGAGHAPFLSHAPAFAAWLRESLS